MTNLLDPPLVGILLWPLNTGAAGESCPPPDWRQASDRAQARQGGLRAGAAHLCTARHASPPVARAIAAQRGPALGKTT